MRLHARAIAAITAGILGCTIYVQAASANTSIPGLLDPQLKGQARLSILGIVAYEGRLFTEGGTAFAPDSPAALELLSIGVVSLPRNWPVPPEANSSASIPTPVG